MVDKKHDEMLSPQRSACAFSASCMMPGPRVSDHGQQFCGAHARMLELPAQAEHGGTEFARLQYRGSRKRGGWDLYAGIVEMA
jgi:hypothetical protein